MSDSALKERYSAIWPHLNERQKRLLAAVDAQAFGRGGVRKVHQVSGLARSTIARGKRELMVHVTLPVGRSRRPGGGKKKIQLTQPGIIEELKTLVSPVTRGDPQSSLKWTSKSSRELAEALQKQGYRIGHNKVAELLREDLGYSLQGNRKTREGENHKDRDQQFAYINVRATSYVTLGYPVISVDTKKKELVGNYKNGGREWQRKGKPVEVNTHDFPDKELGKAIPYGVYDMGKNVGWVNVGITSDTAQFAVESIRRWWQYLGISRYPASQKLLITADCGGSNSYRTRLWKKELQLLSDETGLAIEVCHFPPGTSKWNKIEHRLFCHISMNWRGRPLTSLRTIINLIGHTKTKTGLRVYAMVDTNQYQPGIRVSDEEMKQVNLEPHTFHGEWNYTIRPTHHT